MDKQPVNPKSSTELVQKVKLSDKKATHYLKVAVAVAVIFIITSLSYLVYQNVQSNNRIQQIQTNLTKIVDKQTEELAQIKANQVSNIANNHIQFTAIESLLQQQNDYIKCIAYSSQCVEPTFTSSPTQGTNTSNQPTQTMPSQSNNDATTTTPTPKPNLYHQVLNFFGL